VSASDYFPTVFCACFVVGYGVVAIWMWHGSPEHFERYYLEYRDMAPFSNNVTRGFLRAYPSGTPALVFMALAVGVGDIENARESAGDPSSGLLYSLSSTFIILTFLGWGFQVVVSLFSWPRWLLLPYVRNEKSYWVARREARAQRRAARSSSSGDTSK
jgi:hypothetical protein